MALPAAKQKCLICSDEVSEAEYRRELTCSYAACPGSEHAYHEECITDYLRKLKLPVDRLIGYQCPVVLDNGRPCTGRITATHHRQPLNQKKKQKRVEAAAAAAAAPKPKPPAPKAKEPKQAASGLAVATAAMRPVGEGVVRQTGLTLSAIQKGLPTVKASIQPLGVKLGGAALAVSNNNSMAPERVVRQRVIPGWSGPEKVSKMSTLEQQRAMANSLRADMKNNVNRNAKLPAVSAASGAASGKPSAVTGSVTSKESAVERGRPYSLQDQEDSDELSEVLDFAMWPRDGDSSDGRTVAEQREDFNFTAEDFPAFPIAAIGSLSNLSTPGMAAQPAHALAPVVDQPNRQTETPGVASPLAFDAMASDSVDSASPVSPAAPVDEQDDDPDRIVAHDQLYTTEDGIVVVQDAYGNYVRMEDVYGPAPEMFGVEDAYGGVAYYVVVRQSHVAAQLAQQELMISTESGAITAPEYANATEIAAPCCGGVGPAAPSVADAGGQGMPDQRLVGADQYGGSSGQQALQPMPDDEGGDIGDLLALCMGGATAPGTMAAAATGKPSIMFPAVSPTQQIVNNASLRGYGVIAAAPMGCPDTDQADNEDVDSLMQLLCV